MTGSLCLVETSETIKSQSAGPRDTQRGEELSKSCDAALAQAFRFLGKRWSGVILGTLTKGPAGLTELHDTDLVTRTVEPGPPVSVFYALSEAGAALIPAMAALSTWASDNLPEADRP